MDRPRRGGEILRDVFACTAILGTVACGGNDDTAEAPKPDCASPYAPVNEVGSNDPTVTNNQDTWNEGVVITIDPGDIGERQQAMYTAGNTIDESRVFGIARDTMIGLLIGPGDLNAGIRVYVDHGSRLCHEPPDITFERVPRVSQEFQDAFKPDFTDN